jgi:hypothetical protein
MKGWIIPIEKRSRAPSSKYSRIKGFWVSEGAAAFEAHTYYWHKSWRETAFNPSLNHPRPALLDYKKYPVSGMEGGRRRWIIFTLYLFERRRNSQATNSKFRGLSRELFVEGARIWKDVAPALWRNPSLFYLAENLTQCREYHRKQLCHWSKVDRSLGLTCGGQKVSLPLCASGMRVWERNPSQRALLFLSSLEARLFDLYQSNKVTYRLLTNYKVVPSDILYMVSNFQPNRTEVDFPIGLMRCPFGIGLRWELFSPEWRKSSWKVKTEVLSKYNRILPTDGK